MKKLLQYSLLLGIFIPCVVFASWYNPLTWFKKPIVVPTVVITATSSQIQTITTQTDNSAIVSRLDHMQSEIDTINIKIHNTGMNTATSTPVSLEQLIAQRTFLINKQNNDKKIFQENQEKYAAAKAAYDAYKPTPYQITHEDTVGTQLRLELEMQKYQTGSLQGDISYQKQIDNLTLKIKVLGGE